jgi:hypothetical protein
MWWLIRDVVARQGCGGLLMVWWLSIKLVAHWDVVAQYERGDSVGCGGSVGMWCLSGDVAAQLGFVAQ